MINYQKLAHLQQAKAFVLAYLNGQPLLMNRVVDCTRIASFGLGYVDNNCLK